MRILTAAVFLSLSTTSALAQGPPVGGPGAGSETVITRVSSGLQRSHNARALGVSRFRSALNRCSMTVPNVWTHVCAKCRG